MGEALNVDQETVDSWNDAAKVYHRFWQKNWLRTYGPKYLKKSKLLPYFGKMIGDKKKVKIADIGTGLLVSIGHYWDTAEVEIYPMDLFAEEYARFLTSMNMVPLIPVEKQDMLNLKYSDSFFDIVHCSNALDHCVDPRKAISEMIRVCKAEGYIYLRHFTRCGFKQKYHSLHKWNIDYDKHSKDCVFWTKEGKTEFKLSECTNGLKSKFESWRSREGKAHVMCISIMRKE